MLINGTSGIDELYANQNDQVFGLAGDDILDASEGQGKNLLEGGDGSDRLFSNNQDTLRGGAGEDSLYALGQDGFNILEGGEDNDQLFIVEGGNNTLDGGSGSDRLIVSDGRGYNTLSGGLGNDFLDVSNGTGNNSLYGNEGDDILIGGLASDHLFGGAGDDILIGGQKGSQLTGGTGIDQFFLTTAAIPDVPVEVLDFKQGDDKVIVAGIPEVRKFSDLILEQTGADTFVKANINNTIQELGILRNVQANTLKPEDFNYTTAIFAITDSSATEGNNITFTITRTGDTQTEQSLTVSTSIASGNTASANDFVSKTENITFKKGETQKTFTVQTNDDFIAEGNETFTVSLSKPSDGAIISPSNATAKGNIIDNDSAGVLISETDGNTKVTEGGNTDIYSLVLTSQPTADVIISINSGQRIATNRKIVTFTSSNWNVPQNVTVIAVDNSLVQGTQKDTIQHTATSNDAKYNGIPIKPVDVEIFDNDTNTASLQNANSDVFTIKGNINQTKLLTTLTGRNSQFVNELGVFIVDDSRGKINGIAPGAAGYTKAALERAKVIFSAIAKIPNGFNVNNLSSILQLNSGDNFRFYLIKNGTTDGVKAGITPISNVIFSNPLNQKITNLGTDGFSLAWEAGQGNNTDFQDLVVKIQTTTQNLPLGANLQSQPQGELIDLRGVTQLVKADFVVNREAAYNNFIGFYRITEPNGGIDTNNDGTADILPGQSGYTQAAIRNRVPGIDLFVNNQGTATYSGTFQPDSLFAPFIIIKGRPEAILDNNPNNDPVVYFPFLGANPDKVDHIRLLANNVFGFEDLPNGGDQDFNDMIVRVNLSLA